MAWYDTGSENAAAFLAGLMSPLPEPGAPTVAVQGTTGSTVYRYQIVANNQFGSTWAGMFSVTTDGHASPDGTNFNRLTWDAVDGATSYDVYRITGGATQGKIATAVTVLTLDDTALAGNSAAAPTIDTSAAMQFSVKRAARYFTNDDVKLVGDGGNTLVVVEAPGAGKIIQVVSALGTLDAAAGAYALEVAAGWGLFTDVLEQYLATALVPMDTALTTAELQSFLWTAAASGGAMIGSGDFANYIVSATPGLTKTPVNQPLVLSDWSAGGSYTGGHVSNSLKVAVEFSIKDQ